MRAHFPELPVYARARNRAHAYRLLDEGVKVLNRETLLSSLVMAGHVLEGLGFDEELARGIVERFRAYDEEILHKQHAVYQDEEKLLQTAQQSRAELRSLFEQDNRPQTQAQLHADGAWLRQWPAPLCAPLATLSRPLSVPYALLRN